MESSKYNQNPEYEEYPEYPEAGLTNIGLPPGQLALIIGANAVISLLISVTVVLLFNWQASSVATNSAASPTIGGIAAAPTAVEIEATLPSQLLIYRVQNGDTLGTIAKKFKVPLYDLMVANRLTNEDFIQIDQELIIPVGGLPTVTPTFTAVPPTPTEVIPFELPTALPTDAKIPQEPVAATPLPTLTPTVTLTPTETLSLPNGIKVIISEISGAGNLAQETLVVLNQGEGTSLKGWTLEGSALGIFVFPDIFLFSGGNIRIHTINGQNSPSDLYLGQTQATWPPGTTIIMKDANGFEISRLIVK